MRHFLLYWNPETVDLHLRENYLLNHVGSNQLERVKFNDILWIVTIGEANELGLAGKLIVENVFNLAEAKQVLRRSDLWQSRWHALAKKGTAQHMRGISLLTISMNLRIINGEFEYLSIDTNGGVKVEQLQKMLEIDNRSGTLLSETFRQTITKFDF